MRMLYWACAAALLWTVTPSSAQVGADVPRDHYAYTAIQDLAGKGLIKGFPPDSNFWGKRTATRYEMATIIGRAMARIQELLDAKADRSAIPDVRTPTDTVSKTELAEVSKLVDEFKVELTVIGADVKKLQEAVEGIRTDVDAVKAELAKIAAANTTTKTEVATLHDDLKDLRESYTLGRTEFESLTRDVKAHKVSGYLQARFEASDRFGAGALFPELGGSGTTGINSSAGSIVPGSAGYGFLVRRARLKLSGPISGRTAYGLQVDATSLGAVAVKDAYIELNDLPMPDKWVLTAGLFATPFGVELPYSSSKRESPERAAGFSDSNASLAIYKTPSTGGANSSNPLTGASGAAGGVANPGAVVPLFAGQDRDTGVMATWNSPNTVNATTKFQIGVFNGEGRSATGVRNNNRTLDLIAHGQTALLGGALDLGVSGYYGTLSVRSAAPTGSGTAAVAAPYAQGIRALVGADLRYIAPFGTTFRAEYVGGLYESSPDRSQLLKGNHAQAWYVVARHPLGRRLELAAKYDEFMPITQTGVTFAGLGRIGYTRRTIQGGILYYVDDATRLRLWYTKGLDPYDPSAASGPARSRLGLITTELQVTY